MCTHARCACARVCEREKVDPVTTARGILEDTDTSTLYIEYEPLRFFGVREGVW